MKYFLDSAITSEIETALEMWNIDGVTTNPRHVQASGKPFMTVIREIAGIFVCMAVGLACGTGYVALAAVFTLIVCIVMIIDGKLLSRRPSEPLELRIVVPESLNYAHEFDDIFEKYTSKSTLVSARTSNMGSLYKLRYSVMLRDTDSEQAFMDELRVRNGNLEISLGIAPAESGALL